MIHSQKTFPPQKFPEPVDLSCRVHPSGGDSPSVWTPPPCCPRAVPAGQLLLLPHRKPFTPQRISKLTNYAISLAGKRALLSFHRAPGRAGAGCSSPLHQTRRSGSETRGKQPQRVGCAMPAVPSAQGRSRTGLRGAGAELHPGRLYEESKTVTGFQQHSLPRFTRAFELSTAAPACLTRRVFLGKGLRCFQKDPLGRKTPQNAFALKHK